MRTISILTLLLFFLGCTKPHPISEPTVKIILPDSISDYGRSSIHSYIRNLVRGLNLKNLELGADSLEIRIYEDGARWTPDRLIVIKKEDKVWCATAITYWDHYPSLEECDFDSAIWANGFDHVIIDSTKTCRLTSKCSWDQLIDSLNFFKIGDLPSQRDIKNFRDGISDGISYHIEVATKNRYKLYSYHCPDAFDDESNKNATNILKLISRQLFQIKLCREN